MRPPLTPSPFLRRHHGIHYQHNLRLVYTTRECHAYNIHYPSHLPGLGEGPALLKDILDTPLFDWHHIHVMPPPPPSNSFALWMKVEVKPLYNSISNTPGLFSISIVSFITWVKGCNTKYTPFYLFYILIVLSNIYCYSDWRCILFVLYAFSGSYSFNDMHIERTMNVCNNYKQWLIQM